MQYCLCMEVIMQNTNDVESRIKALKSQIALVQQDRENIHQEIQDKVLQPDFGRPRRSIGAIAGISSFALVGVLTGFLLANAYAGQSEAPAVDGVDEGVLNPVAEIEEAPVASTVDPVVSEKPVDEKEVAKATPIKKPGGGRNGKGPKNPKPPKPPKDDGILTVSDCGDDPLCGVTDLGK